MRRLLASRIAEAFRGLLSRPLTGQEIALVLFALFATATVYCQLWCLIALQKLHGDSMPLLASVHRVTIDLLPAFTAFELGKRVPVHRRWSLVLILLIFLAAFAIAVALRTTQTVMTPGNPSIRVLAAHRLPPLTFAALLLAWVQFRRGRSDSSEGKIDRMPVMPPWSKIEWVRSAGNYVEVRSGGQTRLLRMTLRKAAELLPQDDFVQVHRSVIVNRNFVAAQKGRRSIRLKDGSQFPVGDAYRSNLLVN